MFNSIRTNPTDQYKMVSRVFKNPVTMQQINSHLRISVATGNLYIGALTSNEYLLDSREYDGTNATSYSAGLRIRFIPDTTNASASLTVKIGSLASIPLKKADGTNFAINELKIYKIYTFIYDAVAVQFKQTTTLTDNEYEFDYYFYLCMAILNWIEKFIKKDIFAKTYELLTNCVGGDKTLLRSPFSSLVSFQYLKSGVWTDIDASTYQIITSNNYSAISFIDSNYFPIDADELYQNTKIKFITKMFTTIQEVDPEIIQAMLMILASLSQYRGDCVDSFNTEAFNIYSNIPPAAQLILRQYRIESVW